VVETYFGGQEQGSALARILWGDVNPSGKLPITYPTSDTAVPAGVTNPWATAADLNVSYGDGINVGYKGYDKAGITPLFPFGYGLSYTAFNYSNLAVTPAAVTASTPFRLTFQVSNTGARIGSEVSQVYVKLPASTGEPPKRLIGYARTSIAAGQTNTVSIVIDPRASTRPLSYFDTTTNSWKIKPGTYTIYIGASERNIKLTTTLTVS
jgi:beta-glucosidase